MKEDTKILIIDDLPETIDDVKKKLKKSYLISSATSAESALQMMKDWVPDLILLDIGLPGVDGYELCSQIKNDPRFPITKIIMVSARILVEERLKAYECGADDYLTKPFNEAELMAKVEVFSRLNKAEKDLIELNSSLEEKVKKRTENLLRSEKMAYLGLHTVEIARNLREPLFNLLGNAEGLEEEHPTNENIRKIIKDVRELYTIIKSILRAGESEISDETKDLNINEILSNEIELLKADDFLKEQVETKLNLVDLPPIKGVYNHFSQSFSHIIRNSLQAMRETHTRNLNISTSHEKHKIIIAINDTGCGIEEDNIKNVFDPFFTTKEDENYDATGFGLTLTKKIIEAYMGEIEIKSVVDVGTTVVITLPYGTGIASNI